MLSDELGFPASDTPDLFGVLDDIRARLNLGTVRSTGVSIDDRSRLLAPVGHVPKVLAIGLNYREHARELGAQEPAVPLLFAKYSTSISGPNASVPLHSKLTQQVDYEAELAVVISRTCRDVSVSDALRHVAAYTVANDVSARDRQAAERQWTRSKSFDGFLPLGPWLTTADEVADPQNLTITCSVNGSVEQHASTAQMIFGVETLVSFLSQGLTLQAGDIIITGTPSGVQKGRAEPRWMRAGDQVRCEVSGLGYIENQFVD